MAKKISPFIVVTIIIVLLSSISYSKKNFVINLDDLMTPEEQKKTGISKLTEAEKEELEKWLTGIFIMTASEISKIHQKLGGERHWIKEKLDGGRYLILENNIVWEISPLDRVNTFLWMPLEDVLIIKNDHGFLYPYKIINVDNNETVDAKPLTKE